VSHLVSRQSPRIIVQRLLVMAVLVAVFLLSASFVLYFTLRGRTVEVPNLIGKSEQEAQGALEDQGLRMQIRNRAHDGRIPANVVSGQLPPPGTTVKTGQLVRVSLSLGAPPK
jgi:serine/threonine-protein kinase